MEPGYLLTAMPHQLLHCTACNIQNGPRLGPKVKIDSRGKGKRRKNTSLAAKGALAYRLQRRIAFAKSKMAARGPQNGGQGLERYLPLGFWPF